MGFFDKIKQSLVKTREAISETFNDIFSASELDDDFYDELEESLILADLGVETASKATERLRKAVSERHIRQAQEEPSSGIRIHPRSYHPSQPSLPAKKSSKFHSGICRAASRAVRPVSANPYCTASSRVG